MAQIDYYAAQVNALLAKAGTSVQPSTTGNLADLTTTNKDNLVTAINEVKAAAGGDYAERAEAAAAEAEAVLESIPEDYSDLSDEVGDLKSALYYNAWDMIRAIAPTTRTNHGVTYTWDDAHSTCVVTGTATNPFSFFDFYDAKNGPLPKGVVAGKPLYIKYTTDNTNVKLRILYYKSGQSSAAGVTDFTEDGVYNVPADATGIIFRLYVPENINTTTTTISDCRIITTKTNAELADAVENNSADIADIESGIDSMTENFYAALRQRSEETGAYNLWDEEWMLGNINATTGLPSTASTIRPVSFIRVLPQTDFTIVAPLGTRLFYYSKAEFNTSYYLGYLDVPTAAHTFTTPAGCNFIMFRLSAVEGTTYQNNVSVNYPPSMTNYVPHNPLDVKNSVAMLERAVQPLPEMYLTEAERFCAAVQTHEADLRLLVYADPHNTDVNNWNKYQMLNEEGIFDGLCGLGDFGVYTLKRVPSQVLSDIRNNFKHITRVNNVFFINGNHDTVPYDTNEGKIKNNPTDEPDQMTYKQLYGLYERMLNGIIHVDENDPYNPYYYVDFENSKIRMIVLNSSDIYDNGVYDVRYTNSVIFQNAQLNWFANVALDFRSKDTPSDWSVIVLQHATITYLDNGSNKSLTGHILACAARGVDIDGTFDVKKKLLYNAVTETWYRPASNDDLGIKTLTLNAPFSQYGRPKVICLIHGHDHFDANSTFLYQNYTFPIIFIGADNPNIYDPYYCELPSGLAEGWYSFTSVHANNGTGNPVTAYFYNQSTLSDATRIMYNDALFETGTNVPIRIFDANGKQLRGITPQTTQPTDVPITDLTFTKGRSRPIDIENCSCISIDKANQTVKIDAYGFGFETTLTYGQS